MLAVQDQVSLLTLRLEQSSNGTEKVDSTDHIDGAPQKNAKKCE